MFLPSIKRWSPCLPFRPSASLSWLPVLPHRPYSTANFSLKISGAGVWLSAGLGKWPNLPLISTEKLFSCPLQHQRVLQGPSHSIPSLPATLQLVSLRLFSRCCCHRCYLPREKSPQVCQVQWALSTPQPLPTLVTHSFLLCAPCCPDTLLLPACSSLLSSLSRVLSLTTVHIFSDLILSLGC